MDNIIKRAYEYTTDKYLDLADVPKFIEKLVELHEANLRLQARIEELEADNKFDFSDVIAVQPKERATLEDFEPLTDLGFGCWGCKKCEKCTVHFHCVCK